MTPQERKDLIETLEIQIQCSIECKEDPNESDWIDRTGVLITQNQAQLILQLLEKETKP